MPHTKAIDDKHDARLQKLIREWREQARNLRERGFLAAAATKDADADALEAQLRGEDKEK